METSRRHGETTFYQDSLGTNNPLPANKIDQMNNISISAENLGPRESSMIQFTPKQKQQSEFEREEPSKFSKSAHQKVKIHSDFLKQEESKPIVRQPTPIPTSFFKHPIPVADSQISQVRQPEESKADDISIDRPISNTNSHTYLNSNGKLDKMNLDERFQLPNINRATSWDVFVDTTNCGSSVLLGLKRIASITTQTTMASAFEVLCEVKVQSLPVLHEGKIAFVITFKDFVRFILENYQEADIPNKKGSVAAKISTWIRGAASPESLSNLSVGEFAARQREVLTRSHLDIALIVKEEATLRQGIEVMLRQNSHRLLVVDSNSVLTTIVSQSRILELCYDLIKSHPVGPQKLSELNIGNSTTELRFVQDTDSAYLAFKLMVSAGLSCVPVLDVHGVLVGQISATDIKLVGYNFEYFDWLLLSCKDYAQKVHEKMHSETFAFLTNGVAQVTRAWTFQSVVHMLVHYKIHRVFITDEIGHPTGVLSTCDMLKVLVPVSEIDETKTD